MASKAAVKAKAVKPHAYKAKSRTAASPRRAAVASPVDPPEAPPPEVNPSEPVRPAGSRQSILDTLREVVAKSLRGETGFNGSSANAALKLLGQEEGMFVELKRLSIDPLDGLTREELKQLNDYLDRIAARLEFKSAAAPAGGAAQPGQDPA